jgi:hypothetical protein
MKRIVLVLLVMVVLSGCAISLSPEFSTKAGQDLGMSPIIYYRADWIHGVYGYPSFAEALASKTQITRGALVVDDEKIAFVRYDRQIQKYDYIFQLKYPDLTDVRVFRKGLTRRLVLKTANSFYTLEIVKSASIDRIKTYEFAIFIADKSGKDSSDFSKELAREKGKDPSTGSEPIKVEQKEGPPIAIDKGSKVYVGIYGGVIYSITSTPAYRYFHKKDCKHLWNISTEEVTVGEAIARGKTMCPDCFRD